MPRIYGYMDTDTNVFTPAGQEVQYNPPQGQVAYSAYNQQPQGQQWQGQGYRANTGRQRQYQQWQGNGYRVNVGQPRFSGNGYAPRGYNTNMNYGPWYGQQSYATYPPYAPNQPRYEWMPSSGGGIVPVRMGEWQRQQPVAYEMMYNSQGIPVRVPVYAPMNNSAMPVRVGTDIEGRPYGSTSVNYQAAMPQQTTRQRTAQYQDGTSTVIKNDYNMPTRSIVQSQYNPHNNIDLEINRLAIDNFSSTPVETNGSISMMTTGTPTEGEILTNENSDISTSGNVVPDANGTLASRIAAKEEEIKNLRENAAAFGTGSAIIEDAERELKALKKEQSALVRRMRGEIYMSGGRYSE